MAAVAAYLTAGAAVNWFGGYASVGKAAAAAAVGTAGATTALVAAGAVGGAVFGFIASGGDLKAALTGAITGAAFAYVGSLAQAGSWGTFETALAHGTVGGAGSELGGGSFKDGFVGAFFAAAVNPLIKNSWPIEIKGALRTLAGGTASRLGGGKFANGATSAAMGFLFNEVLHGDEQETQGSCSANQLSCKALPGTKQYENLENRDWLGRRNPVLNSSYECSCGNGNSEFVKTRQQIEPFWFEDQQTLAQEGVRITETREWIDHRAEWTTNVDVQIESFNPLNSRHPELRNWAEDQLR